MSRARRAIPRLQAGQLNGCERAWTTGSLHEPYPQGPRASCVLGTRGTSRRSHASNYGSRPRYQQSVGRPYHSVLPRTVLANMVNSRPEDIKLPAAMWKKRMARNKPALQRRHVILRGRSRRGGWQRRRKRYRWEREKDGSGASTGQAFWSSANNGLGPVPSSTLISN